MLKSDVSSAQNSVLAADRMVASANPPMPKQASHSGFQEGLSVWETNEFPCFKLGNRFAGTKRTMKKPTCFTPAEKFRFGGKEFIALYPCIQYETKNFGWTIQKLWDRMIVGKE